MDGNTKMVYLCNPANPTGTIIPAGELETFIKEIAPKCIILLDEAYTEFSEEPSMAKWVNDYPNLVVAKTFSKIYGMAGARVGFALAHPQTIKQIKRAASHGPMPVPVPFPLQVHWHRCRTRSLLAFVKKKIKKPVRFFILHLEKQECPI